MATATENKVQFNLLNVYYAILTITDGTPSWATPVHIPGAVNLNLDEQGEITKFYADGIVYYQSVANNGYSGDLEMARFPDQMMKDVWGLEEVQTDFVLIEKGNVQPKAFALLFQIDGDQSNEFYCMYNCTATRPAIAGSTNNETKEPKTQTSTISAVSLENNDIMARTTKQSPESVKSAWFKTVYQRTEGE